MAKVNLYSTYDFIYPGPHLDKYGKFDDRTYFIIPLQTASSGDKLECLVFPSEADADEIKFVMVDPTDLWIS